MRQLSERDHKHIIKYILREPEYNTYIIGDIEQFGYENEKLKLYANDYFNGYDSILMRYLNNYVIYSNHLEYDAQKVADFILSEPEADCITGKKDVLDKIIPLLNKRKVRNTHLAVLKRINNQLKYKESRFIKRLNEHDAQEILLLYLQIEEFQDKYKNAGEKELEDIYYNFKSGRSYGIWENNKLISIASSTAENTISAMITNVGTHSNYRNKGFGSQLVIKLCDDLLNEGKDFITIYYDNPEAGKIYNKIGFNEKGIYTTLR